MTPRNWLGVPIRAQIRKIETEPTAEASVILSGAETPGTAENQADRTLAAITGGTIGLIVPMLIGLAAATFGLERRP